MKEGFEKETKTKTSHMQLHRSLPVCFQSFLVNKKQREAAAAANGAVPGTPAYRSWWVLCFSSNYTYRPTELWHHYMAILPFLFLSWFIDFSCPAHYAYTIAEAREAPANALEIKMSDSLINSSFRRTLGACNYCCKPATKHDNYTFFCLLLKWNSINESVCILRVCRWIMSRE